MKNRKWKRQVFLFGRAILSLLLLGFVIYGLLVLLMKFLESFIIWLSSLSSKLDAIIIVALITGSISIVSGVVLKMIDYKKARNEYLAKKREGPYGKYVDMVYKITENAKNPGSYTSDKMKEDVMSFSKEITLWGSPRVAKKWEKFRKNGANPEKANQNIFLIEEIMNEMRKDMGTKRMSKGSLLSFFVNDIESLREKNN